ncbi:hypothetical protein N8E89_22530 (plasmid) [Phyllobacterium sp. A18/5-2]|uniref:hypothetical protein n=1 Tax=Phyllobacterium sp. A18/5-2 TaxID=2978392 RepID=UPI0021C6AEF6|nr:hypothetical protein [Phyllobacterium sp. A18/5-2]UXN66020.1 hypothetical protein N8E89_22530 [Phyllobacterium sp. A18/5-2]
MPTVVSNVKFMNFYPSKISRQSAFGGCFFIAGDQAHSKKYSEDAAEEKELHRAKGAGPRRTSPPVTLGPFDKLKSFFDQNLTA